MKSFALFSIENNYDQPENNLERLWKNKPSYKDIADFFRIEGPDPDIGRLSKGIENVRIGNADYRIQEVEIVENE